MNKKSLSRTARTILDCFREDYPFSAQFRGGRQLRKGRWERVFPGIDTDHETKESFIAASEELEGLGILSIRWARYRRGDKIEALYLEDPSLLYSISDLPRPEEERKKSLHMLRDFRKKREEAHRVDREDPAGGSPVSDNPAISLTEHLEARLETFIPSPCSRPKDLQDLLVLLSADPSIVSELPVRALSIRLFGDSKRLERLLSEADKLALSAAGEKLSARLGLVRSYPEAGLRGKAELLFDDGRVWRLDNESIFCGRDCIERISLVSTEKAVLVVENKETFMTLSPRRHGFSALLYGGGHLNQVAVAFLKLLERSGSSLFYFGDLDPDGLLIFQEAERLLSGDLIPWRMDPEVYLRYVDFGYSLSVGSLARLEKLHPGRFDELVRIMRERGLGVEQELIGFRL